MTLNSLYFGPGPSILPESVREAIKRSLWDDPDLPCSILECSHQFPALKTRLLEVSDHFRRCLNIPEDFEVVFMPGGARLHYGLVACNILQAAPSTAALITGYWSDIAFQEQNRLCHGRVQAFQLLPGDDNVPFDLSSYDFVHGVTNETVSGICIPEDRISHPGLIMDMTSDLGYRLVDWSRYVLVYAGLQKAFGLAGMSVVIIKRNLLSACSSHLPTLQSYASIASSQSLGATPNIIKRTGVFDEVDKKYGIPEEERQSMDTSASVEGDDMGGAPPPPAGATSSIEIEPS